MILHGTLIIKWIAFRAVMSYGKPLNWVCNRQEYNLNLVIVEAT